MTGTDLLYRGSYLPDSNKRCLTYMIYSGAYFNMAKLASEILTQPRIFYRISKLWNGFDDLYELL